MAEFLAEEMVASYAIEIIGIERTKSEMKRLDEAIVSLRLTDYNQGAPGGGTVTNAAYRNSRASRLSKGDIFSARIDQLEGRVQSAASKAMAAAMTKGREIQQEVLKAATTETGLSGASHSKGGRKGPGRNDSGETIAAIKNNVETSKTATTTNIIGWHGWPSSERASKAGYQEIGTRGRASAQVEGATVNRKVKKPARTPGKKKAAGRGVPAANSLGASILVVREKLKAELQRFQP